MAIKLSREAEQRALESIKRFLAENLDDEVGDLKAMLYLEFCLKEIGPSVYNQAVTDVQAHMQDRVVDLDSACYEPEFMYWTR